MPVLQADGAQLDKLGVSHIGGSERGLVTTQDVKKGEPLMYIPKKQIITLETCINSSAMIK